MSTLDELERELGPQLRATLAHMLAGPDADERGHQRTTPSPVDARVAPIDDGRRSKPARLVGVAATVIAIIGVAALALTRSSEPTAPADSLPATVGDSGPAAAATGLSWESADQVGSLGRSSVRNIVAGPTGFVATGMGFDDQRNQGRVWFSSDGVTWQEPAFETFDRLEVSGPATTSKAFYVVAATNSDRTPESEGEGQSTLPDAHLYRSVDGFTWERWGDSIGELSGGLFGVGDGLLRDDRSADPEERTPLWSPDGLSWSPAEFENPGSAHGIGGPIDVVTVDGLHYASGFRYADVDEGLAVWRSVDGQRWDLLPAPPESGRIVAAAEGLMLMSDESLVAYRFDAVSQQWVRAADDEGVPLPARAKVVEVGDLLVAATVEEASMTVFASPNEEIAWQPDPTSRLESDEWRAASPLPTAVFGNRVVVVWHTTGVGGTTAVRVGTVSSPLPDG